MSRFIEKVFFGIAQRVGLIFAFIALAVVVILGLISYENLNTEVSDKISAPTIKFSQYRNPIDTYPLGVEKVVTATFNTKNNDIPLFNKHIDAIVSNLKQLPDNVVSKENLRDRVEILVKIKTNIYPNELQLAYAGSLARLTQQLISVNSSQTDIDDFLKWHDQEFSTQVNIQMQRNLLKMNSVKAQKIAGFSALNMAVVTLGIFIMFVMMLAMLRIERNTRS